MLHEPLAGAAYFHERIDYFDRAPNGYLGATPGIISFSGTPVAMKVLTIDGEQYAWVAILAGSSNILRLYNLATKSTVAGFPDIDLGMVQPLGGALTAGVPGDPSDDFPSTSTAFLHVAVMVQ